MPWRLSQEPINFVAIYKEVALPETAKEMAGMFEGPVLPVTLKIAIPVLIANLVQTLYVLTDTYFISLIDQSSTAILSGTGLVFPLAFLFIAISNSLMTGLSAVTGRVIGERNKSAASRISASGFLIATGIGVPALVFGYVFREELIRLLAGNELSIEAITVGLQYHSFLLPSLVLMLFAYAIMGILLGEGKTGIIAIGMLLSTLLNIILDPILIFTFNMGVAGAGLATTISLLIAILFTAGSLLRGTTVIPFSINLFTARLDICKEIIRIGIPQFVNIAILAVAFTVNNKLIGNLGEHLMNAWIIVGRIDQILLIPVMAISAATITMISQNYGRNNLGRAKRIYVHNIVLVSIMIAAIAVFYILMAPLVFPFFSSVPEVIETAVLQVRMTAIFYIGIGIITISNSTFQSTGKAHVSMVLPAIRSGLISIPLAFILVYAFDLQIIGIFLAVIAGNVIISPIAYFWTSHHLNNAVFNTVADSELEPETSLVH